MTACSGDALYNCKKKLVEALGDDHVKYFLYMKDWFRGKVTKEHFDSNARDLLKDSDVYLHNEFLLAILTKCQLFSSTPPPSNLVSMSYTSPLSSAAPETCKGTLVHDRSSSSASLAHGSSKVTTSYSLMPDSLTPSAVVPEDIFNTENSNVGSVFKGLQCSSSQQNNSSDVPIYSSSFSSHSSPNLVPKEEPVSSCSVISNTASNFNNINNYNHASVTNNTSNVNSRNDIFNNSNSLSSSSNLRPLGSNTGAFTVNNSSSNISIKVEMPLHSLDGNTMLGCGLTTTLPNSSEKRKMSSKASKKKLKPNKLASEPVFEPVSIYQHAFNTALREPHAIRDSKAGHHTRVHCLLGLAELRGRLLLAAWDHGLHAATEGVVLLLHHATKQVLQSVLTAVLKKRHGYKVREGRFVHSLGTSPPNPWLRSAASASDWTADSVGIPLKGVGESIGERPLLIPTAEAAQQNGAHLMSYAPAQPPPLGPINCFELYHTLKGWPSLLPCHTVYSLCMERLSNRLSHPDQRAIAQEELVRQEQLYRHQLRQYRIAPSI
ncbi:transcriptional adapter 1 [Hyalella azteca]|uniref:Transcriptional adapter 1 n=1 Tax=Hyalella azteca TaxID=294128 RepID=A0A8B7NKH9_HYAAZ|nr:transcriptional adapter 1 [Hyalella azteca]